MGSAAASGQGIYLYPKEVFLEGKNSEKVRNHSRRRYRSE